MTLIVDIYGTKTIVVPEYDSEGHPDRPRQGQVLAWDSDSEMWRGDDAISAMSALSDVLFRDSERGTVDILQDNDILVYDASIQKWVPIPHLKDYDSDIAMLYHDFRAGDSDQLIEQLLTITDVVDPNGWVDDSELIEIVGNDESAAPLNGLWSVHPTTWRVSIVPFLGNYAFNFETVTRVWPGSTFYTHETEDLIAFQSSTGTHWAIFDHTGYTVEEFIARPDNSQFALTSLVIDNTVQGITGLGDDWNDNAGSPISLSVYGGGTIQRRSLPKVLVWDQSLNTFKTYDEAGIVELRRYDSDMDQIYGFMASGFELKELADVNEYSTDYQPDRFYLADTQGAGGTFERVFGTTRYYHTGSVGYTYRIGSRGASDYAYIHDSEEYTILRHTNGSYWDIFHHVGMTPREFLALPVGTDITAYHTGVGTIGWNQGTSDLMTLLPAVFFLTGHSNQASRVLEPKLLGWNGTTANLETYDTLNVAEKTYAQKIEHDSKAADSDQDDRLDAADSDIIWIKDRLLVMDIEHDSDINKTYVDFADADSDSVYFQTLGVFIEVTNPAITTYSLPAGVDRITFITRNGSVVTSAFNYQAKEPSSITYVAAQNGGYNLVTGDIIRVEYKGV